MSAHIATLKTQVVNTLRSEERLHALSIYSALAFIAVVVVATFPYRPF